LAWRIQAEAYGGLDPGTRRRLTTGAAVFHSEPVPQGVRILRKWRGRTYEVDRVEGGYRWDGHHYASLSSLALAITGVKRNGPAFFGLRAERSR
jgi:hypothetical protein